MNWSWLHRPLESPSIYRAVQNFLGAGGRSLDDVFERGFGGACGLVLDVGSGPVRETPLPNGTLVGFDINPRYVLRYATAGSTSQCDLFGVVGTAAAMPFSTGTFDECGSVAVLHHLPDPLAADTAREMLRVLKPGGRLSVFDMVRPERFGDGPLASFLCAIDRGRHLRTRTALGELLREACPGPWSEDPVVYAWPRLHGVLFMLHKPAQR